MDPSHLGPPQADVLIGQTIGNYLVTQKLGEGGMGRSIWPSTRRSARRSRSRSCTPSSRTNQEVAARFFNEAKAVNDIGHPNIVDIVDFGILQQGHGHPQLVYFIMEYLAGAHARAADPRRVADAARARAVDRAAGRRRARRVAPLRHRPPRPQARQHHPDRRAAARRDFVKLLDFGIAKLTGEQAKGSQPHAHRAS